MEDTKELLNELKIIKVNIDFIKQHMVDIDSIMTAEDYEALKEYEKEKKTGKLVCHEELKKELGL